MDTKSIIKFYEGCQSIRETALAAKTSPQTVRRILIEHGLHTNPTHSTVTSLAAKGFGAAEIAEKLHLSRATVRSYLPYTKGRYKVDNPTINAQHIRAARAKKEIDKQ